MIKIERFACNMLAENCYIVSDETQECAIIDCGAHTEAEQNAIATYIKDNRLRPVLLLGTHGHLDHHFGDSFIFHTYQLRPMLHKADGVFMENSSEMAQMMFGNALSQPLPEGIYELTNNMEVSFGQTTFKVIATPGHSKGSVCFYSSKEKVLFTGDTLFKGSIGRTDFPGGSMFQMVNSLRLLAQLPDDTTLYPGHGEASTISFEVAHNPYMDR